MKKKKVVKSKKKTARSKKIKKVVKVTPVLKIIVVYDEEKQNFVEVVYKWEGSTSKKIEIKVEGVKYLDGGGVIIRELSVSDAIEGLKAELERLDEHKLLERETR